MSKPQEEEPTAVGEWHPMTRERVTEDLQYQLDNWSDYCATKESSAIELQSTFPGLAECIRRMPEEAGAACFMAARMIRECYSLIMLQQAATK
jgi:hypothetical protein